MQMGRVDAYPPQNNKKETPFTWTDVFENTPPPPPSTGGE